MRKKPSLYKLQNGLKQFYLVVNCLDRCFESGGRYKVPKTIMEYYRQLDLLKQAYEDAKERFSDRKEVLLIKNSSLEMIIYL